MARSKIVKFVEKACSWITGFGRWIGARRLLFVWSAISVAVALFFGISSAIQFYNSNIVGDMGVFVLTYIFETTFVFLKLFVPMMILVIATKYIFDSNGKRGGRASETFRLSLAAALFIGLVIGALYYANAGHIIGNNPGEYCDAGAICLFNWQIARLAATAFLSYSAVLFIAFLALRGVYDELSFMLSKNK
jgi:hypothetical protein